MENGKWKMENGKWKMEANAIKRGQRLLADYAEREHFRADVVWSIMVRHRRGY